MRNKKILLILAAAFLLCACQPTPEQEIVVNQGDGGFERILAEAQACERSGEATHTTPAPSVGATSVWERSAD